MSFTSLALGPVRRAPTAESGLNVPLAASATSTCGKCFERVVQSNGRSGVFGEGPDANARDPMLIRIDGLWHCYCMAIVNGKGYGFCRTSPDLKMWSHSSVVSHGGRVGPGPWFNECPHVVEVLPGEFVYFRNQYYGTGQMNWAYYSTNPLAGTSHGLG